ncbi:MAG: signal peptide peptidase SppA, partial [Sphingomonadales bacterium]|nr:signal peptide peptidase SppA [Sphingomonadales bacterium]
GRVWAGATARQLGLVDRFGSLDDAVALAAERAGIESDTPQIVWIEPEPDAFTRFLKSWAEPETADEEARLSDPWSRLAPRPSAILARALAEFELIANGATMQARCMECPVDISPARRTESRGLLTMLAAVFQPR